MDYTFFQNLTDKIDVAKGDEKKKLEDLRENLLDYVNEVDRQLKNASSNLKPWSRKYSRRKM